MENKFTGRVWKLPDDVDTDTIIAIKYLIIVDQKEMGTHCLETMRPEFAKESKPGDIIVAGSNFGCGSSREQAAEALHVNGINCIIAKSFARIFFRNAINNGMLLIESDNIPDLVKEKDQLTVEINKDVILNGKKYSIPKVPDYLMKILNAGGLTNYVRREMDAQTVKEAKE